VDKVNKRGRPRIRTAEYWREYYTRKQREWRAAQRRKQSKARAQTRANEALTVAAMRVNNPDRSPVGINRSDTAPT
jgi:hypothetical protein